MFTKVLQITAAYKPAYTYGGPTMSVSKLCEALVDSNVELEVFTTTANGKDELAVNINKPQQVDGVTVTYFKRLTKDHTHFSPALLWALHQEIRRAAKKNKASNITEPKSSLIIHIHAWWNLVSILSCSIAKWHHIPVILSPRGMLTNYSTKNRNVGFKAIIHFLMGKRLLNYCHIHATSEKEKQNILAFMQPKSITLIPNLVNLEADHALTRPTSNLQSSTFNLIFLSRIEEIKGLELLFKALAGLNIDWQLTIAGSGQEDYVASLKELAISLNLKNNIHWIGQVKNADKFKLMAKHDLLVLTSYNENFANVVIESLSVGTPVLLSNKVGLADYVQEKELGWITELTITAIEKTILNAYSSEKNREKIRENAPQVIAEDFNSSNLIQKYITFYKQIS